MMEIIPLPLNGAAEIYTQTFVDKRGRFSRLFCQEELFAINGGRPIQQVNYSQTEKRGAIRGLHFQYPPHAEDKAVRCLRGRVFDVMVDLRANSPTFCHWHAVVLEADKMNMVYIPQGFAHGFQTLEVNCELLYLHTEFYAPEFEGVLRYDDPKLNIQWPLEVTDISEKDKNHPLIDINFKGLEI